MASKRGLDGRLRDQNGEIRKKRNDTEVGTLRKELGPGFAFGYRADTHLGRLLKDNHVDTLSQLLKKK
jgi:hypothetical protein